MGRATAGQGSVAAFRQWLDHTVRAANAGMRLPTDAAGALSFGISLSSVKRVLADLRARGLVYGIRGSGTFVGPRPRSAVPEVALSRGVVGDLVAQLEGQICRGELRRGGPLPAAGYMTRQFHLSPQSVRKAYARLAREGYVFRMGRQYWVGQASSLMRTNLRKEILYLEGNWPGWTDPIGGDGALQIAVGHMERELQEYGFFLTAHVPERELEAACRRYRSAQRVPYGVFVNGLTGLERCKRIHATVATMCAALKQPRPPIVVTTGLSGRRVRGIAAVDHGNVITTHARACARYLYTRDYARVVMFLRPDPALTPFDRLVRLHPEFLGLRADADYHTMVLPGGASAPQAGFFERVASRRDWAWLASMYNERLAFSAEQIRATYTFCAGLVEALDSARNAQAWLFSCAADAVAALSWARERRIRLPHDLSIISMEDAAAVRRAGISACVPDWEGIGHLMAHQFIGDFRPERSTRGYLRARALLLQRQTSR